MSSHGTPDSPEEQPVSLDALAEAFAEVLGAKPGRGGEAKSLGDELGNSSYGGGETQTLGDELGIPSCEPAAEPDDDPCELSPRTILEAMLFVGCPGNEPLGAQRAAELMRGVEPSEIPDLVAELNRRYAAGGCPYHIVSEGAGYRLTLRPEFSALRDTFYGRTREARLSQAAVDILAIVAYRQPIAADEVTALRGTPSGAILTQLVRRRLLRIERPADSPRKALYFTTDRFLELFGLNSLADLPQSEEVG